MNFDWSTFILEFINFFILLWILRRFLYRPVLGVIQARQRKIEEQLREADHARAEALAAERTSGENLAVWEKEKTQARIELEKDIATERERLLAEVAREVEELRARQRAQEERERQEWKRLVEERALELGGRFVARLLERVVSPELEAHLIAQALADFKELPAAKVDHLRATLRDDVPEVVSAFPLAAEQRATLTEALAQLVGRSTMPLFKEDSTLLAGLRIHVGSWVLGANLYDELKFFRDLQFSGNA